MPDMLMEIKQAKTRAQSAGIICARPRYRPNSPSQTSNAGLSYNTA